MSKGNSGLFKKTIGVLKELAEQVITRYMRNGDKNTDFDKLPGSKGIQVPKRLSDREMIFLTEEFGKDVMLINHTHPGGTAYPSPQDQELLINFALVGSPQKTSAIIPIGKSTIKFTSKGLK